MSVDCSQALLDVIPQLNAASGLDLVFWTSTELYQWFDEAGQRLARTAGVFVSRDTSLTTSFSQGTYNLPASQVATIQADLNGTVLSPRTVEELEYLDASWPTTQGQPVSFVQNVQGLGLIAVYPAPDANNSGLTIGLVLHAYPPTIASGTPIVAAPQCIREYFTLSAIAEARAKETKMQMQEVAGWLRQLTGWMEQVIEGYWGEAR
ncbi:MAG TPA: hypothetical protein VKX49_26195 [Bryobacteraceae bacterium]|nr:hypothetical protein [Bryobacteraceae bacterium]